MTTTFSSPNFSLVFSPFCSLGNLFGQTKLRIGPTAKSPYAPLSNGILTPTVFGYLPPKLTVFLKEITSSFAVKHIPIPMAHLSPI